MEEFFRVLIYGITGLIGATGTAIPLLVKIRKMQADVNKNKQRLEDQKAKLDEQKKISVEAEWKRILEERAREEARLRARDEEQDRKLDDLMTRFINSERAKAASDERVRILQQHVDQLTMLLVQRCPQCPSRPTLTLPLSDSSSHSSPAPTATPPASPSPSTTSRGSPSDGSSEMPSI